MRIATWNINSVRIREQRVRDFLARQDVDILCLQETKCTDEQFPDFTDAGYQQAHCGLHSFNGVAILSRVGLEDPIHDFGQPGFDKDPAAAQPVEARALGALCDGVRVWSLYVPNGREISDLHYTYKLAWLQALARYAASGESVSHRHTSVPTAASPTAQAHSEGTLPVHAGTEEPLVLAGDFNIAPRDEDVWDRTLFDGRTHVTPRERAALRELEKAGLTEATALIQDQFTYWDYQALRFQKGEGMRIDLQFSRGLSARSGFVDRKERAGKGASDHAPVIIDYEHTDTPSVATPQPINESSTCSGY